MQVNSWRLLKHHLAQRAGKRDMGEVVSDVCGIQAQVLSAAVLAIEARVEGIRQQDVKDALWKNHTLTKTWCMRGTLHLLASSDLPVYVAALKTKLVESEMWLQKNYGVQPFEVAAITAEIKKVLTNLTPTRDELARSVERRAKLTPKTRKYLRSGWGALLHPAAFQGVLAFGPNSGPKVTFLRPDKWVAPWREPSAREAFGKLFRKFLASYGPATVRDFAHWWGNFHGDQRFLLEYAGDDLEEVEVEGHRGLMLKSDGEEALGLDPVRVVRLLPSFDCYAMFYSPREWFVSPIHRAKIFRQTAGWNYPALIVDGFAVGIWSLNKSGRRIKVEVEPFRELSVSERKGVQEEAARMGSFFETPTEVRYSQLAAGKTS